MYFIILQKIQNNDTIIKVKHLILLNKTDKNLKNKGGVVMEKLARKVLGVVLCLSLLLGFSVSINLFAIASGSDDISIRDISSTEELVPQREPYIVEVDRCEDDTFDVYVSDSELAKTKGMRYPCEIEEPYDNSYFKVILTTEGFQNLFKILFMSHYKTSIWIIPDELLGIPVYPTEDTEVCCVGRSKNKKIIVPSKIKYQLDGLIKEKKKGWEQFTEVLSYEDYMDYSAF